MPLQGEYFSALPLLGAILDACNGFIIIVLGSVVEKKKTDERSHFPPKHRNKVGILEHY